MSVYGKDDAQLFARALDSMIMQDYERGPVRIYLCVDGPVSEALEDIIRRYTDHFYRVIRNEGNLGLARSLNRLIDVLEDEAFVFRMDADDFSHPHRVRRQVEFMERNSKIDILGGSISEIDKSGKLLKILTYPDDQKDIYNLLPRRSPLAHVTVCFRRRAIDMFKYYPDKITNQDWALWFKCISLGIRISNIDDVLVDVTITNDFLKRRGAGRAFREFTITMTGIWKTHGLTWKMIYPILRFCFRLLPRPLSKMAYKSSLR